MDELGLISVMLSSLGIFATGLVAIYLKMSSMSADIAKLKTEVGLIYKNLKITLNFKDDEK